MTMDTDYPAWIFIGGLVLLLFVFPTVAAFVAPEGRRQLFFVLTLLFVPGPLGVGFAAIAQSRPEKELGTPSFTCVRCGARTYHVGDGDKAFVCWRCNLDHLKA
jgi:hypothetical protein